MGKIIFAPCRTKLERSAPALGYVAGFRFDIEAKNKYAIHHTPGRTDDGVAQSGWIREESNCLVQFLQGATFNPILWPCIIFCRPPPSEARPASAANSCSTTSANVSRQQRRKVGRNEASVAR